MNETITDDDRIKHQERIKLADKRWAELIAANRYQNPTEILHWFWTEGFVNGLKEAENNQQPRK